jgi:hypothetical protein
LEVLLVGHRLVQPELLELLACMAEGHHYLHPDVEDLWLLRLMLQKLYPLLLSLALGITEFASSNSNLKYIC